MPNQTIVQDTRKAPFLSDTKQASLLDHTRNLEERMDRLTDQIRGVWIILVKFLHLLYSLFLCKICDEIVFGNAKPRLYKWTDGQMDGQMYGTDRQTDCTQVIRVLLYMYSVNLRIQIKHFR